MRDQIGKQILLEQINSLKNITKDNLNSINRRMASSNAKPKSLESKRATVA